jgi:hypothetical protein
LKNTFNRSKSGRDWIRGGEGMDSPMNHEARGGEAPNC